MAGYIGSKAAVVQVDGYTKSEADARYVNDTGDTVTFTSNEGDALLIEQADGTDVGSLRINNGSFIIKGKHSTNPVQIQTHDGNEDIEVDPDGFIKMETAGSERLRIDASGNLMVGKSALGYTTNGHEIKATGELIVSRSGTPVAINRNSSDGQMINLYKDGTAVGSISSRNGNHIVIASEGASGLNFGAYALNPWLNGSITDNTTDIGQGSHRFDDIYATNGSIQTSDRNEKQNIAALTEAEQRVAVAAKGLLRKFRWKSAVAEKGEAARTHFGIIAQDLQAAFAAEGLDASDYAMFISGTWWEHQVEVPAVEADEENGIEAKDAYTRTDTYSTEEEAPEGATERTRLGVRYSELLAFIIGAL
jgi:hypothetical protein